MRGIRRTRTISAAALLITVIGCAGPGAQPEPPGGLNQWFAPTGVIIKDSTRNFCLQSRTKPRDVISLAVLDHFDQLRHRQAFHWQVGPEPWGQKGPLFFCAERSGFRNAGRGR